MVVLACAGAPSRDRIRGSLAGILCGLLAIAAHGFEGALPHSAALTLLLVVSGAVGAAVGSPAGRGRVRLVAALGAGQFLAHNALMMATVADHSHTTVEGSGVAGWTMLAAHAVATVLAALLIAAVERVYAAVSRAVWSLLAHFESLAPDEDRLVRTPDAPARPPGALLLGAISRRGPPISSALATAL